MSDNSLKSKYSHSSHHSGSSLFLLELIIAVGFFAVAGVVCINMFLHAHRISLAAKEKTEAVRITQNCAESFLAADGDMDTFASLLQKAFPEDDITISDRDRMEIHSPDSALFTSLITEHGQDAPPAYDTLHILVQDIGRNEVFSLDVCDVPQTGGRP